MGATKEQQALKSYRSTPRAGARLKGTHDAKRWSRISARTHESTTAAHEVSFSQSDVGGEQSRQPVLSTRAVRRCSRARSPVAWQRACAPPDSTRTPPTRRPRLRARAIPTRSPGTHPKTWLRDGCATPFWLRATENFCGSLRQKFPGLLGAHWSMQTNFWLATSKVRSYLTVLQNWQPKIPVGN